jgi:hypothetical protein
MSYLTLGDLLDLGQANPPSPGRWQSQAQPISDAVTRKDLATASSLSSTLIAAAKSAGTIPVATAAQHVVDAVKSPTTSDVGSAADNLMSAAQSEDAATDSDRLLSAQMISKQIDQLGSDIQAFTALHSGFRVIWDKIRGGFDTSALTSEVARIQALIDTTPLSIVGRKELSDSLAQSAKSIPTGLDWSTVGWTVAMTTGVLAFHWGVGKAQAVAATKAAEVHKKVVKRFTKKTVKTKPDGEKITKTVKKKKTKES